MVIPASYTLVDEELHFNGIRVSAFLVDIHGVKYRKEKVAWFLAYNEFPHGSLRFHDGDFSNRKISNLYWVEFSKVAHHRPVRSWNADKLLLLKKYMANGYSDKQIGDIMGFSRVAIRNKINENIR